HGDGDAAGIDVGRRLRDLDGELPVDVGQARIERALGRDRIKVDRFLRRLDQFASGKKDGHHAASGPATYHFGVYPCLPLNMKPAGSRSILAAMMLRLAVSWRSSRMA